jgi:glycosyltransferase involved in cell wall biosynthesis
MRWKGLCPEMRKPHICILTSQYFNWGKYGGFGSMSRKLAESLTREGYRVSVIVPRRQNQKPTETLNGVTIHSFASFSFAEASQLIRAVNADIFHSQDPTLLTLLAQKLLPHRAHLITCRDPRDRADWWIEFWYASWRRRALTPFNYLTESSFLIKHAVQQAHGVYCPAHFLKAKIQRMYQPQASPEFLPNLIDVPATAPTKSAQPTFTFIARWDRRKRPEVFLELAAQFPEYRFISIGQGEDAAYDALLRAQYRHLPNLDMPGFISRFDEAGRMERILSETWALVNTAAREGLPLTFLEAAAYGCAIVSAVDPDEYASRFGQPVHGDDFAAALRALMTNSPLAKGQRAHAHVKATYENSLALAAHIAQYERFNGA